MKKIIAILATMDTKGAEANFIRQELQKLEAESLLIDIGVIGEPGTAVDVSKEEVALAGGSTMADILKKPTRQEASEIMIRGAGKILLEKVVGSWFGGFFLEREVHTLMTTVLLGVARFDALDVDACDPSAEPGQIAAVRETPRP